MKSLLILTVLVTLSFSALLTTPDVLITKDSAGNLVLKGSLVTALTFTTSSQFGLCPAFDTMTNLFSQQYVLLSCPLPKIVKNTGYYDWKGISNSSMTIQDICTGSAINY